MKNPIIVALDTNTLVEAQALVEKISDKVHSFKLGPKLLYRYNMVDAVNMVLSYGAKVFIDLKLNDIPETMMEALVGLHQFKPDMITMHASSGFNGMTSVVEKNNKLLVNKYQTKTKIIAVTVLTSFDDVLWRKIYNQRIDESFLRLLNLSASSNVDGVVCSAHEVALVKEKYPHLITVVPGIRLENSVDDQKRKATPKEALNNGADYLVIGRPITKAKDPESIIDEILTVC